MLTRWGRKLEPAAWDRPNLRAHFVRSLELRGPRVAIEEQGAGAAGVRCLGRRVRGTAAAPLTCRLTYAFFALTADVPRHMPVNDSVPANDFVAAVKVPFAVKYSPVPPSGLM